MSADNWGYCPKCKAKHDADRQCTIDAAENLYGKVPAFDYNAALNEANAIPEHPEVTLREDYECYTDEDGKFVVSYRCHCTDCGFTFSFNHKESTLERCTTEDWG